MKDIYVRGIFVVFGSGFRQLLWEMFLQLIQSSEMVAPS